MKTKLADPTNKSINGIRMYGFVHFELDDDSKVGGITPSLGAN